MAWFFSRRPTPQKQAGRPYPEVQRSPGLSLLFEIRGRQRIRSVLDLGPSSNETLQFFSSRADGVVVQDTFHSSATGGRRSEVFRFASAEAVSLPHPP
ncbi:MAG: hypothetical protein MI919_21870, partial [Holophagales bacterium]|nr:hypothetical protein [Holophagales bacterium]